MNWFFNCLRQTSNRWITSTAPLSCRPEARPIRSNQTDDRKIYTERRWSQRFITFIAANQQQMTLLFFFFLLFTCNTERITAMFASFSLEPTQQCHHPASGYYVSSSFVARAHAPITRDLLWCCMTSSSFSTRLSCTTNNNVHKNWREAIREMSSSIMSISEIPFRYLRAKLRT